jgi:hypothetical protein
VFLPWSVQIRNNHENPQYEQQAPRQNSNSKILENKTTCYFGYMLLTPRTTTTTTTKLLTWNMEVPVSNSGRNNLSWRILRGFIHFLCTRSSMIHFLFYKLFIQNFFNYSSFHTFGAFEAFRKEIIVLVMSVRPFVHLSAWKTASTGRIIMKFDIWVVLKTLLRKFKFYSNRTNINGTLHEDQYTFSILVRSVLLRTKKYFRQKS